MISFITVGTDPFENNTLGLISTLYEHEKDCELIVIDNACYPAYIESNYIKRLDTRVCFSAALNYAVQFAHGDWLVMVSNDVTVDGSFSKMVSKLDHKTLYGKDMNKGYGRQWLDGWIYVMQKELFSDVGLFDERFIYAGFEDADYCWRAEQKGYKVETLDFPLTHRRLHTRYGEPGFHDVRKGNIAYLENKWGLK